MAKTTTDTFSRTGPVIDESVVNPHGSITPAPAQTVETVEYSRAQDRPQAVPKAGGRTPWRIIVFGLVVLVPLLASVLYYAFIAADQYTAEARFAVRSLADEGTEEGSDAGILKMSPASQDAYVVTSFIHSSEILRRIGARLDYKAMFVRDGSDFYAEFDPGGSAEEFLNYWNGQVSTYIDGPSGIVVLRVRTFTPEDSITLANAILEESETLINELSARSRNDMIESAHAEVERAGGTYGAALAELNRFQKESGFLSPQAQAQETGSLLTGLLAQKLELDSRLFVIQQSNGIDSPTYRQLVLGRTSIEAQIEDLRNRMTGAEVESFANTLNAFARLETDRMVAEKLYEATRRHYEMTLAAAMRKALYLTAFVRPMLPEESLYPARIMTPVLLFFFCFVLWATLSLAWASVEDHRL
jgi:capsular polysaccharide transport system permease protein